jgi:hypothetical protein
MRRIATLCAAFAAVLSPSLVPAVHAAPSKPRAPHPALWRIATPKATVHLFGSVHVGTPDVYPLATPIREAFRAAQTLVLEMPLDPASEQRATQLMMEAAQYPPPDTLADHVDADTRAKLREALRASGLPARAFEPMRPWFAAVTVGLLRVQALGYTAEFGIDRHFHDLRRDKRVDALETVEEQVAVFRELPEPLQAEMLRQTLRQLDEMEGVLADTFAAWRRGDDVALDALLLAPLRQEAPDLYARLFTQRNRRMADRLAAMLERGGSYFVVVGAGHLVGPNSVIKMLRKRGFEIARV